MHRPVAKKLGPLCLLVIDDICSISAPPPVQISVTRQNNYYNYFRSSEPMAPRFKYSGVVPSVNIKSWKLYFFGGTLPIVVGSYRLSLLFWQCLLKVLVLDLLPFNNL